jgi:hypothetical protein
MADYVLLKTKIYIVVKERTDYVYVVCYIQLITPLNVNNISYQRGFVGLLYTPGVNMPLMHGYGTY